MPESRDWKTVLEDDPFKSAEYLYSENVDTREQPRIEGIPGDIHEIEVFKKDGKYSICLKIFMDDLEGLTEEEVTARLKALGADPNTGWES